MSDSVLLTRAFHYACECHAHQKRKGAAGEPYVNPLADVARPDPGATAGA